MERFNNCIIIGGTGRNIGKTTLTEKIIKRFEKKVPVTAVKIANIKSGEEAFHGHEVLSFQDKIRISRETRTDDSKDSMRYLKAGATASWYIQTEDTFLPETFPEIEKIPKKASWVICESNNLRNFIRPALFIMVKGKENSTSKKKVHLLLQQADVIVEALHEKAFDTLVNQIEIENGRFVLSGTKNR